MHSKSSNICAPGRKGREQFRQDVLDRELFLDGVQAELLQIAELKLCMQSVITLSVGPRLPDLVCQAIDRFR